LEEEVIDGTTRTISYTYDAVSNRLTRNDSGEGNTTYQYDKNDRLLKEVTNGVTTNYTYDNNGNTLSKTTGTDKVNYQWNAENRLVGLDNNGDGVNEITNKYDSDGIRISQIVNGEETRFLVDKNRDYAQVLEEYTPSKIIKASYIYGNDLISQLRNNQRSFYHVDGLGSTRALTDINGLVSDRYAYEAFGEIIKQLGNTKNLYLFAGEQRDPNLGLDYLRARYLDVSTGRFYGRDTFFGYYKQPITLHKYLYANANSVNFIDPSGKFGLSFYFYVGLLIGGFTVATVAALPSQSHNSTQGDTSLGPQYNPNHPHYHRFYQKTYIMSGDQTQANRVYEVLKKYPAPMRPRNGTEVQSGEVSILSPIVNPVQHFLFTDQLALVNVTLPGHNFHPGKTVRKVIQEGGNIFIETTGDGEGLYPLVNVIIGPSLFRNLDIMEIKTLVDS
jgi:RHS repeat-associated protein